VATLYRWFPPVKVTKTVSDEDFATSGVLPKTYEIFNGTLLKELLKKCVEIPASLDYDAFAEYTNIFLLSCTDRRQKGRQSLPKLHCPLNG